MNNPDPIQRFLGVWSGADPRALLGLPPDRSQMHDIESALRERLASVFQHPDGRSPEAEEVRRALRQAAEQLKREALATAGATRIEAISADDPPQAAASSASAANLPSWLTPRKPSSEPPLFNLTAFDRLVLAVLVASGGWNAQSRARLVALAAAHGVTVQGLMRVVQGLSQYARAGGTRLGVTEITGGQSLSQYITPAPAAPALGSALLDRLAENLSAELKRDDPWPTIKLAVIFGALTLGALILAARLVLFPSASHPQQPQQPQAGGSSGLSQPAPPILQPSEQPPQAKAPFGGRRIATYPKVPTFLGNALPGESIKAVEQFTIIAARLDELARKLMVEDQPSEAVFRLWEAEIDSIAIGWQLADGSTRRQVEAKLVEALRAAGDRSTVSDRLLNSFVPSTTLAAPLDIWRGAWKVATTWRIAAAADPLSPVITHRAAAMLQQTLAESAAHRSAEEAAAAWLDALIPQLVSMIELNHSAEDYWELWLAAQRGLGLGERHVASIVAAMHAVLATDTDLARPGPTVNVLGRLLHVAIESRSDAVRDAVQSWLDDESIPSRDLWVLTSLLSMNDSATWFSDALVLPEDADMRHRWRIRDELGRIWPSSEAVATTQEPAQAAGRAISVDPQLGSRWSAAVDGALAQPPLGESEGLLRQIVQASRLIEAAAALAAQDHTQTERLLAEIESKSDTQGVSVARAAAVRIGQPIGPDATWAVNYQQAGKSPEQRIEAIRTLRTTSAGDLGPIDADALVREVYRGSPAEVRAAAQEIVLKFANGPNVAQAMLDQFADAPASDPISKLVGAFTGQPLPGARDGGWAIAARVALIEHVLQLRPQTQSDVDALAAMIAESYAARLARMRRESSGHTAPRLPQHVAAILAQAWYELAEPLRVANPLPEALPGLRRRGAMRSRLVDGPIQQFAANQLAILELLAFVTVAEQPAKREAVAGILRASAIARDAATSVLEQSLVIERTALEVWHVRLGLGQALAPPTSATELGAAGSFGSTLQPPADMRHPSLEPWLPRLEALQPSNPLGYFELAEEISDAHAEPPGRDLARWLFAVAGTLDPAHLGRSACLALADHETNVQHKRRLLALASLMGAQFASHRTIDQGGSSVAEGASGGSTSMSAAMAMSEGLSHYRRGQGARALEAFRKPGATELLRQYESALGVTGGTDQILDDCRHFRGAARPTLAPDRLARMLRIELALLSGDDRSWASDLLLGGGQPLIEVDPDRLAETLGVNVTRVIFRNGKWGA